MFNDRVELKDLSKMSPEYKEILAHQLLANGEGELSAGDTYINSFYPLAPDADERYVCAQFGMEEIDHFRRFAKLLKAMDIDTDYMVHQAVAERQYFPADSMTTTFDNWEERAAFSFLCELEGHYQIKEMVGSTYGPLAEVAPIILKEEARHYARGLNLMRQAASSAESKERAQAALDCFYPLALDMFGRSESRRAEAAVQWGLRKYTNGELRDLYKEDISKQITKLGYQVPADDPSKRKFL